MTPAVTIRFQLGTDADVGEAVDWVSYLNGNASTAYGAIRAQRGHPEPYNVEYFYLGNEIVSLNVSCAPRTRTHARARKYVQSISLLLLLLLPLNLLLVRACARTRCIAAIYPNLFLTRSLFPRRNDTKC